MSFSQARWLRFRRSDQSSPWRRLVEVLGRDGNALGSDQKSSSGCASVNVKPRENNAIRACRRLLPEGLRLSNLQRFIDRASMATITGGSLCFAAELQLSNGLSISQRNLLELSPQVRVQMFGRDFPSCSRARCSVGCSRDSAYSYRGGKSYIGASENFDTSRRVYSRRSSISHSDKDAHNGGNPAPDEGFRVYRGQSDVWKSVKTVGMVFGGVVLALGFGALRFCKPAYAENVAPPPTVSSPLEAAESKSSEAENVEHKSEEVVIPEDQSTEVSETSEADKEFEPPFGEGSDLTNDPAEVLLRSYLHMNPADIKALQALLFLRLKKGEVNAAGPVLKKLTELQPDNLEWKYIRAQADEFAGDLSQARQGFEEILQIRPLSARAWQGLAIIMHRTGEDEEALKMLSEAVQTAVDSGQSKETLNLRMLLGQLHTMQGDLEKAMALYNLVVEEDPQDYRPYLCQGLVYSIIGEDKEAEKCFRRYRKLCPKDLQQRGFLDELLLRAKSESKELRKRAKLDAELKKKGKTSPKPMRQPLASGAVPRSNQDAS